MQPADGITVRQKSRAFFQRYRSCVDVAPQITIAALPPATDTLVPPRCRLTANNGRRLVEGNYFLIRKVCGCAAQSRLASARQEPADNFLVQIATKLMVRIAPTAMELVLLGRLFGECRDLFFGLSLVLRKRHPFANDFSARAVVFHVHGSLAYLIWDGKARPTAT